MSNFFYYLWLILLALYIISPLDAHPLLLDDLIASGILFYLIYRNSKRKKHYRQYNSHSYSHNQSRYNKSTSHQTVGPLTIDKAYELLGVSPSSSLKDINKSYKEKMSKSHPDKVSHLSKELQEKAKELALQLNEALNIIKRHKKY
jgi:hypothetical protein